MAVEARHQYSIFPPQLLANREIILNPIEANSNIYNTQMGGTGGYGRLPLSGTATTAEAFLPTVVYGSSINSDSFPHQKPLINKSDSSLTYNNYENNNLPLTPSRKRSRESCSTPTPFSFLGNDMSFQIQEQQFDIDRLISQHMEKVRMEVEERKKRQVRIIMDVIEEGVMKKLKAKEDEIEKIGKLNWALEERVKSLCIENQIWRDLAQSNEATANALRTNLEQVLASAAAQVKEGRAPAPAALGLEEEVVDDAESCCGSSWEDNGNKKINNCDHKDGDNGSSHSGGSRLCRNCRKEESCVLLLPCRHLCLCTVCGSSLHTCPVCKSPKTVSVHVNMS
ncbi:hypothetical protein AB3S75_027804 [Citrus x aurantiifolia]